jgi:hypothetical protein
MHDEVLPAIETFLVRTGMADSTFGRKATGDWRLLRELRGDEGQRPRRLYPETRAKIRDFMSAHDREQAQAAALSQERGNDGSRVVACS